MPDFKYPLKVFLCHIIPLRDAHADRDPVRTLSHHTRPGGRCQGRRCGRVAGQEKTL